jgi:hypothetical protein
MKKFNDYLLKAQELRDNNLEETNEGVIKKILFKTLTSDTVQKLAKKYKIPQVAKDILEKMANDDIKRIELIEGNLMYFQKVKDFMDFVHPLGINLPELIRKYNQKYKTKISLGSILTEDLQKNLKKISEEIDIENLKTKISKWVKSNIPQSAGMDKGDSFGFQKDILAKVNIIKNVQIEVSNDFEQIWIKFKA